MTWPGVTFRTELPEIVRRELDQFSAALRAHLEETRQVVVNAPPTTGDGGGEGGGGGDAYDLDYTGDYAARVYNDGDIVIGPDGIAYVCVQDNVTTPPVPWPGVGIASSQGPPGPPGPPGADADAALDATYWVSSQHAKLTAERNLGALSSGYVKSASSGGIATPSTVAVIPIADGGTGATTAPLARTNLGLGSMAVQNANAVAITGGAVAVTSLQSYGDLTVAGLTSTANLTVAGIINTVHLAATGNMSVDGTTNVGHLIAAGNMSVAFNLAAGTFTGNGAQLTNLNASALTTGLVPTARLGSGTANAGTFLRGDQTWAAAGIPAGLIAIFSTSCPVGWSRVSALDGRFPRGSGGWGGTGGASSHRHGLNASTGAAGGHSHPFSGSGSGSGSGGADTTNVNGQDIFFGVGSNQHNGTASHHHHVDMNVSVSVNVSGTTGGVGDHSHSVGGDTTDTDHMPPWFDVVFCMKD